MTEETERIFRKLDKITEDVTDVRERLGRLESQWKIILAAIIIPLATMILMKLKF